MKERETVREEARQRIYVTLHPDAVVIARKLGNGVVSRGIDHALFNFKPRRKKHGQNTKD